MALVSQDNIPNSGKIQKPTSNPAPGVSNIQKNLSQPVPKDNFVNNESGQTWHSKPHSHPLNNGLGNVKYGKGVPDNTVAWNVATSNQSTDMDYSPIGNEGSRIQKNFSNDVYHIMSPEAQRGWSGPRTAAWLSEPHLIRRPDEGEPDVNQIVAKVTGKMFGTPVSLQDAIRYSKHLASPRGMQFLNNQNVATKKAEDLRKRSFYAPASEIKDGVYTNISPENRRFGKKPDGLYNKKVLNPIAIAVSRMFPVQMNRYTDERYSKVVDWLTGGTPLRSLAIDGLQKLAEDKKLGLSKRASTNLVKLAAGDITVGDAAEAIVFEVAKGKAIEKANFYGQKFLSKFNKKESKSAVSPKKPAPPETEKDPAVIYFPSDYKENKPYVGFTTWKNIHFGTPDRAHWLGMQIWNYSPLQASVMDAGIPVSSIGSWREELLVSGIKSTIQDNEQVNRQYGYKKSTPDVGLDQVISGPDNDGTLVTQTNKFNPSTKYDKIDKIDKRDKHHDKLHDTIYDDGELKSVRGPVDSSGEPLMTKNWNHSDKKYKPRGEPAKLVDVNGQKAVEIVGVNIPENKIIKKQAVQTSHIDGKSPDGDGNYSVGVPSPIDRYKAHLYGDIVDKRNDTGKWSRHKSKDGVSQTLIGKYGVPGRNGDEYQSDRTLSEEISIQDNLDGQVPDDLIVFKIKILNTEELIVMRAYIDSIDDSVTPNWSSINYVGRPDPVYIYKGAERKVTLNWSMVSNTKVEHTQLWKKANKLIGLNYPSYAEIGSGGKRMVPPFVKLTIGDYIADQPGYFEGINVKPKDASGWEIEPGSQLPHHIDVSSTFVFIGDYLPDLAEPKFINVDGAQK